MKRFNLTYQTEKGSTITLTGLGEQAVREIIRVQTDLGSSGFVSDPPLNPCTLFGPPQPACIRTGDGPPFVTGVVHVCGR